MYASKRASCHPWFSHWAIMTGKHMANPPRHIAMSISPPTFCLGWPTTWYWNMNPRVLAWMWRIRTAFSCQLYKGNPCQWQLYGLGVGQHCTIQATHENHQASISHTWIKFYGLWWVMAMSALFMEWQNHGSNIQWIRSRQLQWWTLTAQNGELFLPQKWIILGAMVTKCNPVGLSYAIPF